MTVAVEFSNISRHYGNVKAVDDVSISVAEGEFFSMLGPSGSGKTTCLRLIAGFEQPSAGSIRIFGKEAAGVPPYEREVNTVFQDYALFPHMSVLQNVAYGLRVKGINKTECCKRAEEALALVALADYGHRKPSELSGGQRQRVALARALVNQPRVLLLDEPLGALDLKLREQMQLELKTLHKKLGITFIYVTHDQGEALSMSDRVAVFNKGKIEQVDHPRQLYTQPKTSFVANFVGTANVVSGDLAQQICGSHQPFSIRPEHIRIDTLATDSACMKISGEVLDIQYHGATSKIEVAVGDAAMAQTLTMVLSNTEHSEAQLPQIKQQLTLSWPQHRVVMLEESH
ncbi:MAG TPA: ABC transporter ATP-binding protein [Methylophilaceae bacterium]|nr:ABC transporter ATP-binding protein [Methylophilaceae bacterium]